MWQRFCRASIPAGFPQRQIPEENLELVTRKSRLAIKASTISIHFATSLLHTFIQLLSHFFVSLSVSRVFSFHVLSRGLFRLSKASLVCTKSVVRAHTYSTPQHSWESFAASSSPSLALLLILQRHCAVLVVFFVVVYKWNTRLTSNQRLFLLTSSSIRIYINI